MLWVFKWSFPSKGRDTCLSSSQKLVKLLEFKLRSMQSARLSHGAGHTDDMNTVSLLSSLKFSQSFQRKDFELTYCPNVFWFVFMKEAILRHKTVQNIT